MKSNNTLREIVIMMMLVMIVSGQVQCSKQEDILKPEKWWQQYNQLQKGDPYLVEWFVCFFL